MEGFGAGARIGIQGVQRVVRRLQLAIGSDLLFDVRDNGGGLFRILSASLGAVEACVVTPIIIRTTSGLAVTRPSPCETTRAGSSAANTETANRAQSAIFMLIYDGKSSVSVPKGQI